ncbi:uracil-xanthine permease [Suttonella indologenes]|uniref:Uracil-xanthine permease n=1 Tax=Suttonella indologenes TaxID=13276 RepID=A0A380MII2_9GAMM|nr:solute carrier family 23 protein [Suttonella indologenes]SUO91994.1 uracil-xanthine permease [Suttonella indologenes]
MARTIVKELKNYYGVGSPCRTLLYCLRLAALYYFFTSPTIAAVHRLLPPVVIEPVIIVIGLSVAKVASEMAMGQAGGEQAYPYIMFVFVMNRL